MAFANKSYSDRPTDLIARVDAIGRDGTKKFREIAIAILDAPEAFVRSNSRETCDRLGTSEPTLIRFCQALGYKGASEFRIDLALAFARDQRGLLAVEPLHQDRRLVNVAQKQAIARVAAARVSRDRNLLIDSGSTAEFFARALQDGPGKTIMTTSLTVAQILLDQGQHDVMLTGGRIRAEARSLTGGQVQQSLAHFQFDTFVMGADSADPASGLSTFDEDEAIVTRAMMSAASRSIALIDQDKFGPARLHRICRFNALDCVITDLPASSDAAAALARFGAQIVHAPPVRMEDA